MCPVPQVCHRRQIQKKNIVPRTGDLTQWSARPWGLLLNSTACAMCGHVRLSVPPGIKETDASHTCMLARPG